MVGEKDPSGTENPYVAATVRLRSTLVSVALFSALVNILMLTGPLFMLQVYDRVLSSGSVPTLLGLFGLVVGAYVFLGLYDLLRTRLMSRAGCRLDQQVGPHVFDLWIHAGLQGKQNVRRPINDLTNLRTFLASPGMLALFDLPWTPFFLVVVFIIHTWLGWLALAGAVLVCIVALVNQALTYRHFVRAMAMDGMETSFVDQSHRSGEAVVSLGMLGRVRRHWQDMRASGLATGQVGGERAEGFAAFSKAFRLLLQSALLGLGGYLALQQEISAGMIIAASIIAGRALAPVDQVIGQWRMVVRARESHRRLKEFLAEVRSPDFMELPAPKGQLSVRGVTKFAPGQENRGDRPPILQNISFDLSAADGLGVIGPSASGKTSLARILVGAWSPDVGDVRLDGATLDQWTPEQLGPHIGYLPQSLELLAGTVQQNIARFDPEAKSEDVIAAAQVAGVHEMILQLPEGYGTRIGLGCPAPLSGGQLQRIGLARAVYGMPRFVVLDEPNANLDASGDEALSAAITHMRQAGSVVVVMAHRPSAIAAVNKLMVLNNGCVVQFGEKAEVLREATKLQTAAAPNPAQGGTEGNLGRSA